MKRILIILLVVLTLSSCIVRRGPYCQIHHKAHVEEREFDGDTFLGSVIIGGLVVGIAASIIRK